MNNKDKIILYLDDQLNPKDKEDFERELKNSPELIRELENYKMALGGIKELNIQSADKAYFGANIPLLRGKAEKKKKFNFRLRLIYASSSAAVIILLALTFFLFRNIENTVSDGSNPALTDDEIKNFTENLSSQELEHASNNVTDSAWNDLLSDELNLSNETADSILKSFNGSVNYTEDLNEEEASFIYDRLINKEFFR